MPARFSQAGQLAQPTTRPDDLPRACPPWAPPCGPTAPSSRSTPPPRAAVRCASAGASDRRAHARAAAAGRWLLRRGRGGRGAGSLYNFVLDGRELPDPYARFLPEGVHGPAMVLESSYPGATAPASRARCASWSSTSCTSAPSPRRAPTQAAARAAARPGRPGDHRRRADAGGRLRRPPRLGLRRRGPLRALRPLRHARRAARLRRRGPPPGPGRAAGRGLQPPRPGGELPAGLQPRLLHPADSRTPGATRSTSPTRWCGGWSSTRPAHWLTEFRFDGLRLDAIHAIVDPSPRHILRELADEVRGAAAAPAADRRGRTQRPGRHRAAGPATPSGPTTSTTPSRSP